MLYLHRVRIGYCEDSEVFVLCNVPLDVDADAKAVLASWSPDRLREAAYEPDGGAFWIAEEIAKMRGGLPLSLQSTAEIYSELDDMADDLDNAQHLLAQKQAK